MTKWEPVPLRDVGLGTVDCDRSGTYRRVSEKRVTEKQVAIFYTCKADDHGNEERELIVSGPEHFQVGVYDIPR